MMRTDIPNTEPISETLPVIDELETPTLNSGIGQTMPVGNTVEPMPYYEKTAPKREEAYPVRTENKKQSPLAWILCAVLGVALIVLALVYSGTKQDLNNCENNYRQLKEENSAYESQINDYKLQIEELSAAPVKAQTYDDLTDALENVSFNGDNASIYSNMVAVEEGSSMTFDNYATGEYIYWAWDKDVLDVEKVSADQGTLRLKITGKKKGIGYIKISSDQEFKRSTYQVVLVY